MRKHSVFVLLSAISIGWLLIACGRQEEPAAPQRPVTSEEVKKETEEALETAAAYTQQQRQAYQERMEARLREFDKKIDEVRAKLEQQGTEAGAELDQQMQELRKKREAAQEKLDELRTTGGKAWGDIKTGMDAAMKDLSAAIDTATSRFAQKDEPQENEGASRESSAP